MDLSRRSVALCVAGIQAEFERRLDDARRLHRDAWDAATDDYDRCVAAHYVAHLAPVASEQLRWNLLALEHASRADQEQVASFYGSLYVNVGYSYEAMGDVAQAEHYYALAAQWGVSTNRSECHPTALSPPARPKDLRDLRRPLAVRR